MCLQCEMPRRVMPVPKPVAVLDIVQISDARDELYGRNAVVSGVTQLGYLHLIFKSGERELYKRSQVRRVGPAIA